MKIFYTRTCSHLLSSIGYQAPSSVTTFSDGELLVTVHEDVAQNDVWVIASTPSPAESIIELLLLLDTLQRMKAKIHLLITYFGYARQDYILPGQALSVQVLFNCLKQYTLKECIIVHIHNVAVERFFQFTPLLLLDFFQHCARNIDCIVAPDKGAADLATTIAGLVKKEFIVMNKIRASAEHIETLEFDGDVRDKKILIVDDMITTAGTIVRAASLLKSRGAQTVYGAATHGIFSDEAITKIEKSDLDRVYVTNTLAQQHTSDMITVFDIGATLLQTIMRNQE